jgi:ABC-type sugar transport system substrate-binding protein
MHQHRFSAVIGFVFACSIALGMVSQPAAAETAKEKILIGMAVPVLANPFWKQEVDFAQRVADELGGELIVEDANQDEGKQLQIISNFASRKVDAIITAPVTTAVAPALIKAAGRANIPIFFAERTPGFKPDLEKYPQYIGFVGADSHQGALATAKALYDAGARKIVATTGTKGSSIAEDRIGGLKEFASQHPDFKVLQVQYGVELREDGIRATENYLSAYPGPGFDGIWNYDDGAAIGAAAALKQANLTGKVLVTGFDAESDGAQAIKAGEVLADSGGQFIDGGFAYIMAFDYLNGHKPKNPYVVMDYLLVTKANVDKYIEQFGSGFPPYDIKKMSVTFTPEASTDAYKIEIQ